MFLILILFSVCRSMGVVVMLIVAYCVALSLFVKFLNQFSLRSPFAFL